MGHLNSSKRYLLPVANAAHVPSSEQPAQVTGTGLIPIDVGCTSVQVYSALDSPSSKIIMGPSRADVPKPGPAKLTSNAGLDEWLEEAKQCHYLPESVMKELCEMVKEVLMEGMGLVRLLMAYLAVAM